VERLPLVVDMPYVHRRQMMKSTRVRFVVFRCAVVLVTGCATKDWGNETVGAQEQVSPKG
jgi:hypothetical protein